MPTTSNKPLPDSRPDQAARVADYLEKHPASTLKEIDAACDTGSVSKVLSTMSRSVPKGGLGYGITKGRRYVLCAGGTHRRKVNTYTLICRPSAQPDLFQDA